MIKNSKGYLLSNELVSCIRKNFNLTIYEIYDAWNCGKLSVELESGFTVSKTHTFVVSYKDGCYKLEVSENTVVEYKSLSDYYKALHKQFNDFTVKRDIKLVDIGTYLNKGVDVYYDNIFAKRNKIESTTKFTIDELNSYKFYIFA